MPVLWNDEVTKFFMPQQGFWQGDPLSSYLFDLYVERLVQMIFHEINRGRSKPISLGHGGLIVSYLFFTDALFLFRRGKKIQTNVIKTIMDSFCGPSVAKVNYNKSKVFIFPKAETSNSRREC